MGIFDMAFQKAPTIIRLTVMISGGMDPVHVGHLDLIEAATEFGEVIVALNSGAWLIRKKGFALMQWSDRARLVKAIRNVADVFSVDDSDGTVCEALRRIHPTYFANGGDRTTGNSKEHEVC